MSKSNKASVRTPSFSRTPLPEGLPEHFLRVRQAEAAKLGLRAHGNLVYEVLLDPERARVFLRLIANSGSGSFSDEPVLIDKLVDAVASRDTNKPLRGSILQGAITGKSVCNAGFLAAVLVAEGLFGRDPAKRFDLLDLDRWQSWVAEQLAVVGDLVEVRLKSEDVTPKKARRNAPSNAGAEVEVGDAVSDGESESAEEFEGGDNTVADDETEATADAEGSSPAEPIDTAEDAPVPKGSRRSKGRG